MTSSGTCANSRMKYIMNGMNKEERERERSVSKLFNTIKYIFHYNYSIKMPYCVAVGCSNNSFRKNREKCTGFYSF